MSGFIIDITGDLGKTLDDMTDEIRQVVDDELNAFGIEVVSMAKELCPVNEGFLRNSITYEKLPLEVDIVAAADYAAFVEFGTGVFAEEYLAGVEPEFKEFAQQFFVNGKGRLPARPFLVPAIMANVPIMLDNIKSQLG